MFIIISENISLQIVIFSLPDSIIEANSVDTFKNRIDKYWNNFEITGRLTSPDQRLHAVKVFLVNFF